MSFVERANFPSLARPEAHLHRGADLVRGSVTADQLAADSVGASEIAAGTVGTSELADASVTAAKLAVMPQVKVNKTADQGVADATFTQAGSAVTWSAEQYDSHGMWVVGSPSRFTCQLEGLYLAVATIMWDAAGAVAGTREAHWIRNGADSTPRHGSASFPSGGAGLPYVVLNVTGQVRLAVNDYLEVWAFHNTSGTINVVGNASNTVAYIYYLGDY